MRVYIDNNHMLVTVREGLNQSTAGLAIATDQVKRFSQSPDAPGKQAFRHRLLKGFILYQRQYIAQGIDPCHYSRVEGKGDPHTLSIGKFIGYLAETDGGRHETDKIESVKETHVMWITSRVLPRAPFKLLTYLAIPHKYLIFQRIISFLSVMISCLYCHLLPYSIKMYDKFTAGLRQNGIYSEAREKVAS